MPKRHKKPHDFSIIAHRVVEQATAEAEEPQTQPEPLEPRPEGKNPHAVALGRLGGKKGGKARATKLTSDQRKDIARKAANARWGHRQQ